MHNGPAIEVRFRSSESTIQSIDLKLRQAPGLFWEAPDASPKLKKQIEAWLKSYARGENPETILPLEFKNLPPFTTSVLRELSSIPFGKTVSYQELAMRLGNPKAARAVGQGCGRNPFPLIIPCHRVLAAHKGLGGFSCGLPIKECLLEFEEIL